MVMVESWEISKFSLRTSKKELSKKYKKIIFQYINRDFQFFNLIKSLPPTNKIKELHIFSHSIGAGLFLGYKDRTISMARERAYQNAFRARRNLTYKEVVDVEKGAIQTDDLLHVSYLPHRDKYRKLFARDAFIKIWGCNSGVDNWVYSDGGVTDPSDNTVPYYWRAFNEKNTPKSSIAKAMARFFNVKVYGARSGASIEVKH